MRNAFALLLVAALALPGCSLFSARPDPQTTATLIRTAASVGVNQALEHGYDEDQLAEKQATAMFISAVSQALLHTMENDEDGVSAADLREILNILSFVDVEVPPEVRIALEAAIDILIAHVRIESPASLLDPEAVSYIRALLEGAQAGAELVSGPVEILFVE